MAMLRCLGTNGSNMQENEPTIGEQGVSPLRVLTGRNVARIAQAKVRDTVARPSIVIRRQKISYIAGRRGQE